MGTSKRRGVSFLSLLGIAFIVLKLCKVINWSWWFVTLPLWGGFAFIVFVLLVFLLTAIIAAVQK